MDLNEWLALSNAILSAISTVLAVLGYRAIRRMEITRHRNLMIAAAGASLAFMIVFVYRFVRFGFTPFRGQGAWRAARMLLVVIHEPVAVVNVILVAVALVLGLAKAFGPHREVARVAYPIWLYVLVTGILLYVLVYQFPQN